MRSKDVKVGWSYAYARRNNPRASECVRVDIHSAGVVEVVVRGSWHDRRVKQDGWEVTIWDRPYYGQPIRPRKAALSKADARFFVRTWAENEIEIELERKYNAKRAEEARSHKKRMENIYAAVAKLAGGKPRGVLDFGRKTVDLTPEEAEKLIELALLHQKL